MATDKIQVHPEDFRKALMEQLGGFSDADEASLEISLELCKAYCRMMADSFDKACRNSGSPDDVLKQFEVVNHSLERLKEEMSRAEKSSTRLIKNRK